MRAAYFSREARRAFAWLAPQLDALDYASERKTGFKKEWQLKDAAKVKFHITPGTADEDKLDDLVYQYRTRLLAK